MDKMVQHRAATTEESASVSGVQTEQIKGMVKESVDMVGGNGNHRSNGRHLRANRFFPRDGHMGSRGQVSLEYPPGLGRGTSSPQPGKAGKRSEIKVWCRRRDLPEIRIDTGFPGSAVPNPSPLGAIPGQSAPFHFPIFHIPDKRI
jgi:hypothetical protein